MAGNEIWASRRQGCGIKSSVNAPLQLLQEVEEVLLIALRSRFAVCELAEGWLEGRLRGHHR